MPEAGAGGACQGREAPTERRAALTRANALGKFLVGASGNSCGHRQPAVANPGPVLASVKAPHCPRSRRAFGLDTDCALGVVGIYCRLPKDLRSRLTFVLPMCVLPMC